MSEVYARDLDLNLLRIFVVVARAGSVTTAAGQLYVTQPAVSAALKRLTDAVGAPLFARRGRGIVLTARGARLLATAEPALRALVDAARAGPAFDPATTTRTVRVGLSDDAAAWLLPDVVRALAAEAPGLRLVVLPVQFRTIGEALVSGAIELAVTVADDLPADIRREPLFHGRFVVLHDPRHGCAPDDEASYFARAHVIVSYNGDLRGVVEDALGRTRRVRCSVPAFGYVPALIDGSDLIATVPSRFADAVCALRPHLRATPLPLPLGGAPIELLVPAAVADDPAVAYVAARLRAVATPP